MEECINCKSFKVNKYPLNLANSIEIDTGVIDGRCQKDQKLHRHDDTCEDFEQVPKQIQQSEP